MVIKQITACDMFSRWNVIEDFRSASAGNARRFLETLIECSLYPVKAIRVDGGSEFQAEFEQTRLEREIGQLVLPPLSSKLCGHVDLE